MSLNFNIIFTPGAVNQLLPFTKTLLEWSNCSFRLVSNACTEDEKSEMGKLCEYSDRLDFLDVGYTQVQLHGVVLNDLQRIEKSKYFCFLDSDILTNKDILIDITPKLSKCDAFFSGAPSYFRYSDGILPKTTLHMKGRHHHTDDGSCLGSTYFAIYENEKLGEVINFFNIGFESRSWEELSLLCQDQIRELELHQLSYDTGKLINILMIVKGYELCYEHIEGLMHLGGYSSIRTKKLTVKRFIGMLLRNIVPDSMSLYLKRILKWPKPNYTRYLTRNEKRKIDSTERRKHRTKAYYGRLLANLSNGTPLPPKPVYNIEEVDSRIEYVSREVIRLNRGLYRKHIQK